MLKTIVIALLPLFAFFGNGSGNLLTGFIPNARENNTGTLEKMIVANASVTMDINLNRLNGTGSVAKESSRSSVLRFDAERDSFFTALVFNNEFRGTLPSAMGLIPQNSAALPAKLNASYGQLALENMPWGETSEMVVRDAKTGFVFFNIEGQLFDYN